MDKPVSVRSARLIHRSARVCATAVMRSMKNWSTSPIHAELPSRPSATHLYVYCDPIESIHSILSLMKLNQRLVHEMRSSHAMLAHFSLFPPLPRPPPATIRSSFISCARARAGRVRRLAPSRGSDKCNMIYALTGSAHTSAAHHRTPSYGGVLRN